MTIDQATKYREKAGRSKYRKLYLHLCLRPAREWRTTFSEIESILGFDLPASARSHRQWWENQSDVNGRSQALAWSVAGWETAEVDMEAETLLFRLKKRAETKRRRRRSLDEFWPVHPTAVWPEGLSLCREDLYEDRI